MTDEIREKLEEMRERCDGVTDTTFNQHARKDMSRLLDALEEVLEYAEAQSENHEYRMAEYMGEDITRKLESALLEDDSDD